MATRVLALAVLVALAFSPAGALAEITIVEPGSRSVASSLCWFGYCENDGQATDDAGPFAAQANLNFDEGETVASSSASIDSVIAPGHINVDATGMASGPLFSGPPTAGAGMTLSTHVFEIARTGHARVRWTFVGAGTVQGGVWLLQPGHPPLVSLTHEDASGDVTVDLQPGQYSFGAYVSASAGQGYGSFDSSFQVHAELDVVEDSVPVPSLSGSALVLLAAALLGLAVTATRRRNAV